MTLKILLDLNVMEDAVQAWTGMVPLEAEVLGQRLTYLQSKKKDKERRPESERWRQDAIDALPHVAAAIREERVRAFTTLELEGEAFRIAKYPAVAHEHSLFVDCAIETLPAPLERSKWGLSLEEYVSNDNLIEYCRRLISLPDDRVEKLIMGMRANPTYSLTEFEEMALRQLHVFRAICHKIQDRHLPDALHLWTAELNGMDFFLSHETRFRNVMKGQKVELHCRIATARELADRLNEATARGQ